MGAKKEFRQRQDEDGRDELPQIERGGKERHHGRSRVLAAFDGGNGQQVGHTDAITHADKGRADQQHRHIRRFGIESISDNQHDRRKELDARTETVHQVAEDQPDKEGQQVEGDHDQRDGGGVQLQLTARDDGKIGGKDEEHHGQQQHTDHRGMELEQLTGLEHLAALVGGAQLLIGQPADDHHQSDQAE